MPIDGKIAAEYLYKSRKYQYITNLQLLGKIIVEDLGTLLQQDGQTQKLFNKCNTHYGLELYTITVLLFGHSLILLHLVLESSHQTLKSSLFHNVGASSYNIAMQNGIARDQFGRLHKCWSLQKSRSSLSEFYALILRCIVDGHCRSDLCGDICSSVKDETSAQDVCIESIIDGGNNDILQTCTVIVLQY